MLRRLLSSVLAGLALATIPSAATAQLATPNPAGVAMGHLHFSAKEVEPQRRFWIALGGRPTPNLDLDLIAFPGVYVVTWQRDQIADMAASTTPMVSFKVKDLDASQATWRAAGVRIEPGRRPGQVFAVAPDGLRVEMIEDPAIGHPIQMYRVHVVTPAPKDAQAWYGRVFGGVPGTAEGADALVFPGGVMTIGLADGPVAPTRGHTLDHWGFEVRALEQFCRALAESGVALDRPYRVRRPGEAKTALAYVLDPWGTAIELTEFLTP